MTSHLIMIIHSIHIASTSNGTVVVVGVAPNE